MARRAGDGATNDWVAGDRVTGDVWLMASAVQAVCTSVAMHVHVTVNAIFFS